MDKLPILKIDPEFKDLIRPLRRKEYLQLEENIPQQMDIFENLWTKAAEIR